MRLFEVVVAIIVILGSAIDNHALNIQATLESFVCKIGLNINSASKSDENWKLYLQQRWYHDKKSCYKENQVNNVFISSNALFVEDKHFVTNLIGKDSKKDIPISRELQTHVIVGDIKLKHLKYDTYIWTGRVSSADITSILNNKETDMIKNDNVRTKPHEIRSIRGPISHASVIYSELSNDKGLTNGVLYQIKETLLKNSKQFNPVIYGDSLLLLSLLYNVRNIQHKAISNPELAQLYRKAFKNNICLIPDSSDVMPEANSFLHLNYSVFVINKNMTFALNEEFANKFGISIEQEVYIISPEFTSKELLFTLLHCKFVISLSLRGLILSDSLNIPNVWLYNSVEYAGSNQGTWEYNDYYLGIGKLFISHSLFVVIKLTFCIVRKTLQSLCFLYITSIGIILCIYTIF